MKRKVFLFLAVTIVLVLSGCLSWVSFWVPLPEGLFEPAEFTIPDSEGQTLVASNTMELEIPSLSELSQEIDLPLNPRIDDLELYLTVNWETNDQTPLEAKMYLSTTNYSEAEENEIVDVEIEPNEELTLTLTPEKQPIADLVDLMNGDGGTAYFVYSVGATTTETSTITVSFSGKIKVRPFNQ